MGKKCQKHDPDDRRQSRFQHGLRGKRDGCGAEKKHMLQNDAKASIGADSEALRGVAQRCTSVANVAQRFTAGSWVEIADCRLTISD